MAVLHAIRTIREKARERLVLYQYYLAKAYEYRILEPYPGDFRKNRLFEKLASDFEAAPIDRQDDDPPALSVDGEDFNTLRTIYLDELRSVVSAIITGLNEDRPEPLELVQTLRLNEDELAQLNDSNEVAINLAARGLISDNDVNTRIVDIEVLAAQSAFVADTVVGPGTGFEPADHRLPCRGIDPALGRYRVCLRLPPPPWCGARPLGLHLGCDYRVGPPDPAQRRFTVPADPPARRRRLGAGQSGTDALSARSTRRHRAAQRGAPGDRGRRYPDSGTRPGSETAAVQDLPEQDVVAARGAHGVTVAVSQSDLNGRRNGRGHFHRFTRRVSWSRSRSRRRSASTGSRVGSMRRAGRSAVNQPDNQGRPASHVGLSTRPTIGCKRGDEAPGSPGLPGAVGPGIDRRRQRPGRAG